jgi:hypothetical protein
VLVKWLWVSVFKMLVHPAVLPITLATFVSVAGPGGFAEIGRHVSAVPTVTVTPAGPPTIPNPPALLVRVVHDETPAVAAPAVEPDVPELAEIADEPLGAADEAPTVIEVSAQTIQPPAPDVPSVHDDEPMVDPSTPEEPAEDPTDGGSADDGAGDVSDNGDPPDDDDTGTSDPPEDDPDIGAPDDAADDGSDGSDEAECDPPGTGPEPHEGVPPGHDQNGDGIDDRCQEDGSEGQDGGGEGTDDGSASDDPPGDEGASDEPVIDGGASDDVPSNGNADVAECDPPGNGHDNHGTPPPGHDKNDDGFDDRCQEAAGNPGGGERHDVRKNNDDG